MRTIAAALALIAFMVAPARAAEVRDLTFQLPDGTVMLYGLLVPDGYNASQARSLILALHSGGQRMRHYGSAYTRALVGPAASRLGAIIVAPDCAWQDWTDPAAERAVLALMEKIMSEYTVDRRRVLVTGFSMGGRGTWFMASRHKDLFTASIPMAASVGDLPIGSLATMPTYVIHSRKDEVVPFAPAERNAKELERLGRPIRFQAVDDLAHFEMLSYVPALRRGIEWVASSW